VVDAADPPRHPPRRFEDFKATGIADNILAARLKRLVAEGLFERRAYQERPVHYEYLLTEKGRALLPVITALRDRGEEWTAGPDRSPRLAHRACGHDVALQLYCPECERAVPASELTVQRTGERAGAVRRPA
jgi:DNA-binding HxlR family transcriptional regulator